MFRSYELIGCILIFTCNSFFTIPEVLVKHHPWDLHIVVVAEHPNL